MLAAAVFLSKEKGVKYIEVSLDASWNVASLLNAFSLSWSLPDDLFTITAPKVQVVRGNECTASE